jgi:hypothetical protein
MHFCSCRTLQLQFTLFCRSYKERFYRTQKEIAGDWKEETSRQMNGSFASLYDEMRMWVADKAWTGGEDAKSRLLKCWSCLHKDEPGWQKWSLHRKSYLHAFNFIFSSFSGGGCCEHAKLVPWKTGNLSTGWSTISFSSRTLLHAVSFAWLLFVSFLRFLPLCSYRSSQVVTVNYDMIAHPCLLLHWLTATVNCTYSVH